MAEPTRVTMRKKPSWLRHKLMGSYMWPMAFVFLLLSIMLPSLTLLSTDERLKRILEAFGNLFNTVLTEYLGLIPLFRERNIPLVAIFVSALALSFAAAVSAVVLAFFDGAGELAASRLIQLLLGPVLNYMFATIIGAYSLNQNDSDGLCEERQAVKDTV